MSGVYVSQSPVLGKAFLESVLAAYSARPAAALVVTPKVRLTKDPGFNPSAQNVIADFTGAECDFSGYTAGGYALTLGATARLGGDSEGVLGHVVAEASTGVPQVGNTVYGYWIDDGTNVIQAERFVGGATIDVAAPGDFCEVNVRLPLTYGQTIG